MDFEIGTDKSNFLLLAIAALFGLIIIIIGYYIMASRSNKNRSRLIRDANNRWRRRNNAKNRNNANNINNINNVNNANNTNTNDVGVSPNDDGLVGIKPADIPQSDVPVGFRKRNVPQEKQVFHINNNIYTYDDSEAVCKAFGGDLATYEQLVDSYKKGADWCSYGWTKGQLAMYPTQYKTWLKMQGNEKGRRNDCGSPGLNGGYFENKHMLFGVNCYGNKPAPRAHEKARHTYMSDADLKLAKKVAEIRSKMGEISVSPFNREKWSSCKK